MNLVNPVKLCDLCPPNMRLHGDSGTLIHSIATLGHTTGNSLAFAEDAKILARILEEGCGAIIARKLDWDSIQIDKKNTTVLCESEAPSETFNTILLKFQPREHHPKASCDDPSQICIPSTAFVDESAKLGRGCIIREHAYVGPRCILGENVRVDPHAMVLADCLLGNNVTIGPNTVIGSSPNWYFRKGDEYRDFAPVGRVVIASNVTIGASVTIDRGLTGDTLIGQGTRVGNLVQIGHDVEIGKNVLIVAQTGISGNVRIEDGCRLYAQSGVAQNIHMSRNTELLGKSGLSRSVVQEGTRLFGIPAMLEEEFARRQSAIKRLDRALSHEIFQFKGDDHQRFLSVVAEQLGQDQENLEVLKRLEELNMDSLDVVELAMGLEDDFGIAIPDDEVTERVRLIDVYCSVARKTRSGSATEGKIKKRFLAIVSKLRNAATSNKGAEFAFRRDAGASEFDMIDFGVSLEREFGIHLTVDEMLDMVMVRDAFALIFRKGAR